MSFSIVLLLGIFWGLAFVVWLYTVVCFIDFLRTVFRP